MATKKKPAALVELRDGLPRYREDDVRFVLQELPAMQPISVPEFVRRIGFDPRPHGVPSQIYARILAAFHKGTDEGLLSNNDGRKYRVVGKSDVPRAHA